jgi:uncharacterized membrane protein YhaH (DUF805 family)
MDFKYLYMNWTGRARRKDYWLGGLLLGVVAGVLIGIIMGVLMPMGGAMATIGGILAFVVYVIAIVGGAALAWKRMHDYDKSGWWLLVPVYGAIVAMFLPGTAGPNRFGPDPKGGVASTTTPAA